MKSQVLESVNETLEEAGWDDEFRLIQDRRAIAAKFLQARGKLDVRHLWTRNGQRFYRANWWTAIDTGNASITQSEFVCVEDGSGESRVVDQPSLRAA